MPPDMASMSSDDINLENWVTYQLNRPGFGQPLTAEGLSGEQIKQGIFSADTAKNLGRNAIFSGNETDAAVSSGNQTEGAVFPSGGDGTVTLPGNQAEMVAFPGSEVEGVAYSSVYKSNQRPAYEAPTTDNLTTNNLATNGPFLDSSVAKMPTLEQVPSANFRYEAFLTEGDKLSGAALDEVKNLEQKLDKDGDIATFYDDIRKATEENLKRSFGREVGK